MTHSSIPNDIAFAYRGFWIESEPFDQSENGLLKTASPTPVTFTLLKKTVTR